jgi:SAM-dependent methyltransferase
MCEGSRPWECIVQHEQFDLHAELEQSHWWFTARRRILTALLQKFVPPDPERLVVDVGCGTGGNIAALADQYACVGIDTSEDGIRHAKDRFPEVEFICGTAPEDLSDRAGRADAYLLTDVLEHVPDDKAMLGGLVGAMRSGAFLLLTVPADYRLWSEHDIAFGHYRRYSLASLPPAWKGLPVKVRLLSHYNSRLYWPIRAARTIGRWRGRAWGDAKTDVALPAKPVNAALQRVFASEQATLLHCVDKDRSGYRQGVSLVAVLEKVDN